MITHPTPSENLPRGKSRAGGGVCTAVCRSMVRIVALAVALLAYGSVPSTALVQSEVESQLSEILGEHTQCDARYRVRGPAGCRNAGWASSASSDLHGRAQRRVAAERLGERLSLGKSLPLRC
jgi:hypothetical protein